MLLTFMLSMLLAITRNHHKEVRGPGYWAVGNLVVGLGMVLVLIQLDTPKLLFLPSLALIGAGLGLYLNGIQAFVGKTPDHRIPVALFILLVVIDVFFVVLQQNLRVAVSLGALVFAGIYFASARSTFSRDEGIIGNLFWIASSLFLLMALFMLGRAFAAVKADVAVFDNYAIWPVNAYTFMLGAVSQFFISSLFVLMLSYRLNQNLESIATIDGLTGILNRRGLEDSALKMQGICKRINLSMGVLLIDMDHFKKVNDKHGHLFGDDVLRQLTKIIAGILRSGDVLGRYGGEEFCVFLPNTTEKDAAGLAERIRIGVEKSLHTIHHKNIKGTVSIGVADSVRAGYDFKGLVAAADSALYTAKNSGRNRVVSFTSITRDSVSRESHVKESVSGDSAGKDNIAADNIT
ncbi:GGDEF domain-containing protein [Methylotenera versatilis]|nr:GGDEF domain-containing protein [Methylotenera versatilis]